MASVPGGYVSEVRFADLKKTSWMLSHGLVFIFLLLIYANPALWIPELESLRLTQLVAGAAIFIVFVERTLAGKGFPLVGTESWFLLAFLGAAGLSCFMALWISYAVDAMGNLAKMAAAYFLIVHVAEDERCLRGLIWALVLGGLFPAGGSLYMYFHGVTVQGRAHWLGNFGNPNDLAFSLVVLVPLAVFLAGESRGLWKAVLWGIAGVFGAAIYVTFSRGGMLGLLGALLVLGLGHRAMSSRILTLALLAGGAAAVAYYWSRPESFSGLGGDVNFQQRIETIRAGLAMAVDHPLLGVGIGCSIVAWPLYAPPGVFFKGALVNHNTYVQALAETGILGFLAFTFLVGAAVYHARRLSHSAACREELGTSWLGAALEASLWGFLLCGLSGGYLVSWPPYLIFGLIVAANQIKKCQPRETELPVDN